LSSNNGRLRPLPIPLRQTNSVDRLVICYNLLIAFAVLIFSPRIELWPVALAFQILCIVFVLVVAGQAHNGGLTRRLHDWYPAIMLYPLFIELSFLIHPIHPTDFDRELAALDIAIFGGDPVAWLQRFSNPWAADALQLSYMSFYVVPVALMCAVYACKPRQSFREAQFGILLCFYLSYLGYLAAPALGPRFTGNGVIYAPEGVYFSSVLQEMLNRLERAGNMRDAFPSGHAAVALMVQWYSFRWFPRSGILLLPLTTALLLSTVYLGYHYLVDVAAGALLGLACLALTPRLERVLTGIHHEET
jgi:membrane-associated phospholipid phosphatase